MTILEEKVQTSFCFLVTVIPAGKGTLCENDDKPIFDDSANLSGIPSNKNGSKFCHSDSTTPFTSEFRPLKSLDVGHDHCQLELSASQPPQVESLVPHTQGPE